MIYLLRKHDIIFVPPYAMTYITHRRWNHRCYLVNYLIEVKKSGSLKQMNNVFALDNIFYGRQLVIFFFNWITYYNFSVLKVVYPS